MKFGCAFLVLFALAMEVKAVDQPQQLRGLANTFRHKRTFGVRTYKENLGECTGAVCGLWGDPHIISCDGVGYDCNAVGLFTLMKNHLYNIQGRFVHVGYQELKKVIGWKNFPEASITNDLVIESVEDPTAPLFQFSYPSLDRHDQAGLSPSEDGCRPDFYYSKDMENQEVTIEDCIVSCRERCEGVEGCKQFYYKASGECHLADASAKLKIAPKSWERSVAGVVDKCGHPQKYSEMMNQTEWDYSREMKNGSGNNKGKKHNGKPGCPALFYVDGELQDISDKEDGGFLYGDGSSYPYVKLIEGTNRFKVVQQTASGALSEIVVEVNGQGLGEIFSCSFNMFVCLPEDDEQLFKDNGSLGLLGTPNGNRKDEWMTTDGSTIALPKKNGLKGQTAFDYCLDNWCVSQDDSKMTYSEGQDYGDVKCFDEEYVEFELKDDKCVLTVDQIKAVCEDFPPNLIHQCEKDCCYGECAVVKQEEETIEEISPLSDEMEDIIYDDPEPAPCPAKDIMGTTLDFANANVTENNLHDGGIMTYEDIGLVKGRRVDLTVSVVTGTTYTTSKPEKNGKIASGKFGNINLQTIQGDLKSGEGNFRFCLIDHETKEPATASSFRWSVYDIDERHASKNGIKEKMIMDTSQATGYLLWPNEADSEIKQTCEDSGESPPCAAGERVVFHSSTKGTGPDNPTDPGSLTDQQKMRSIIFSFENTSCWDFTYDHYCRIEAEEGGECRWYGGGNFLFSGEAPQVVEESECSESQLAPTDAPTDAPIEPTDAPVEPTAAPVEPTDAPVKPTEAPTAGIVENSTPTEEEIIVPPAPECPYDVTLLKTSGVTDFPPLETPAVQVLSKDTTTVTVALNQVWDSSESIDSIYYEYQTDGFDRKCFEKENIDVGATYDEITMYCGILKAQTTLTICLADPTENGFLQPEDNAAIPQCCQSTDPEGTPTVCYTLNVICEPGCPEGDLEAV